MKWIVDWREGRAFVTILNMSQYSTDIIVGYVTLHVTSCQRSSSDVIAEKYPVSWTTCSSRKICPLGRNDIATASEPRRSRLVVIERRRRHGQHPRCVATEFNLPVMTSYQRSIAARTRTVDQSERGVSDLWRQSSHDLRNATHCSASRHFNRNRRFIICSRPSDCEKVTGIIIYSTRSHKITVAPSNKL